MRIVVAVPEAHVSKPVLDGALEAVTRLNERLIKSGETPTASQLIDQGAKWKPEKPGDEHFDHGALIAQRGHGDCDDWAPLRAAELRVTGEDPDAKAIVYRSGGARWHAVVQRGNGEIDDPSLAAGMPGPGRSIGVMGAALPIMRRTPHDVSGAFINTPHLAMRPIADRHGQIESWQARADLPWHWHPTGSPADLAMVTLHRSPVPDQTIVGALRGAWRLGLENGADPETLKRISALREACEGASWEELAEAYGPDHATAAGTLVEGFFGKALRKLGRGVKKGLRGAVKIAKPFASLVPGGGLATAAFNMASPLLKSTVTKQRHLPPAQRRPIAVSPMRAPVPRAPVHHTPQASIPQFLPYPYPLPYPVPGWAAPPGPAAPARATTRQPGVAWPPRR